MTTPLIMLVLMIAPYLAVRGWSVIKQRDMGTRSAAAVGLGLLFALTASGHFFQTDLMAQMLPPWVPQRIALVYLTGILELAIALGFFVPRWRRVTGWLAAIVLVLLFSSKHLWRIHSSASGRARMGPCLSFDSNAASNHHLGMGLLVHDPAARALRMKRYAGCARSPFAAAALAR